MNLRLSGLTGLDRRELDDMLPAGSVRFERATTAGNGYGELVTTTAVVLVSAEVLRLVAIWLVRTRRNNVVEQEVEIEEPSGRRITTQIRVRLTERSAPEAQVLERLMAVAAPSLGSEQGDQRHGL
jgi:ABC-type anion transport system duplicated permease subunit